MEGVTKLEQGPEIEFSMKDALGPKGNGTLWKEFKQGKDLVKLCYL